VAPGTVDWSFSLVRAMITVIASDIMSVAIVGGGVCRARWIAEMGCEGQGASIPPIEIIQSK
jgi:hypothetical protein